MSTAANFYHCQCPALGITLTHAKERLTLGIELRAKKYEMVKPECNKIFKLEGGGVQGQGQEGEG